MGETITADLKTFIFFDFQKMPFVYIYIWNVANKYSQHAARFCRWDADNSVIHEISKMFKEELLWIVYVCNKCLTSIFLYKCIFIHTQAIKFYPLYRTLVGLSMYLLTNKAIKHYPLYQILVGVCVCLSTHKAINLYPLYRTMVNLSMYLSTHKAYRTLYILSIPSNGSSNRP